MVTGTTSTWIQPVTIQIDNHSEGGGPSNEGAIPAKAHPRISPKAFMT